MLMHTAFVLSFNSLNYKKVAKQAGSVGPGGTVCMKEIYFSICHAPNRESVGLGYKLCFY